MNRMNAIFVLAVCLLLGGCSAYVNIPKQPGDIAAHDPNEMKVATAVTEGLRALAEERRLGRPFKVVLFDGTDTKTAREILPRVSPHAIWEPDSENPNMPIVQAQRLLIRDTTGKLDVTLPQDPRYPLSNERLVTVTMKWDIIKGWQTKDIRTWKIAPQDALQLSYRPRPSRQANLESAAESGPVEGAGGTGSGSDAAGEPQTTPDVPAPAAPSSSAVRQVDL